MVDYFDIARAYRDSVQSESAGAPRTGSAELESIKKLQDEKARQAVLSVLQVTKNALTGLPYVGATGTAKTAPAAGGSMPSSAIQKYAQQLLNQRGWGSHWDAYNKLVMKESGWNPKAQNPTSTAYGIGQFLDSTWKPYGAKTSDPKLQIKYMLDYIGSRYGDPSKALNFHLGHNWY